LAFVSYGEISGGLRAVEQLRLGFAELHALTLRDSVSFANPWRRYEGDGRLAGADDEQRAMAMLASRLRWWAATVISPGLPDPNTNYHACAGHRVHRAFRRKPY